jgi:hypothetical protein
MRNHYDFSEASFARMEARRLADYPFERAIRRTNFLANVASGIALAALPVAVVLYLWRPL